MTVYQKYSECDLLRLAKRVNNTKRSYLLVNPLQGKHIPVDPEAALTMMQALGKTVKENYEGKPLVIGFSETATAIGSAVATEIGDECFYTQTTRELDEDVQSWIFFSEEHSHATEQKLCADGLDWQISHSDYILLVDDEISTGKTILNIVSAIRNSCPSAEHKPFVVASVLNRVDKDHLSAFAEQGISFVFLLHLDTEDYEERVRGLEVQEASSPLLGYSGENGCIIKQLGSPLPRARQGVAIAQYLKACHRMIGELLEECVVRTKGKTLVLGTEEFMFPALLLAQKIKETGAAESVKYHATTRSPIGICHEQGYPITNGVKLHSIYDKDRYTYLYDLESYDTVIIFTDAKDIIPEAVNDLARSLEEKQCRNVLFFYGSNYV